jgi:vacuolar protein sorting-associated protein 13A/C
MSLLRMGKSSDSVRFLDDVDLTFSLDGRSSSSQQMTNIEVVAKPIVFRASYRDINLITSIINKAIEKYGISQEMLMNQKQDDFQSQQKSISGPHEIDATLPSSYNHSRSIGKARVLMTKEQVSRIVSIDYIEFYPFHFPS